MTAPYTFLLLLPLGWWAVRARRPQSEGAAAWAVATAITLFVGLRYQVGGDWNAYLVMYERAAAHPFAVALQLGDPAYMALAAAAAKAGLGAGAVNLVCAAILAAGVVAFCRRQPSPPPALLVAVPVLLLVIATNSTRQATAIGLELLALAFAVRGDRGKAAASLGLAFLFHWSAAALLPLAAILWLPEGRRTAAAAAFWALAVAALAAALLAGWPTGPGEAREGTAIGVAARLLPSAAAAALLVLLRRRLALSPDEGIAAVYLSGLTFFCLALLPSMSMPADRLGYFTIPLQMLVLPRIGAVLASPQLARAWIGGLIAFYLALFWVWLNLSPYSACMKPYGSYLERPALLLRSESPEPLRLMCIRVIPAAARRAAEEVTASL